MPRCGSFVLFLLLAVHAVNLSPAIAQSQSQAENHASNFESVSASAAAEREAGRTEQAIRDYQQAVAFRPDWVEGWWYLGSLLYDGDRYREAIPVFQSLVKLAPQAGPAWNFLGLCEFETKDYASALTHLEKGRELGAGDDPEIARVSAYHLGLLLTRSGAFERASVVLLSTATKGQSSPQLKTALGLALLRVPLLPEEVDPSRDGLLLAAGNAAVDLNRGDAARAADQLEQLVREYPAVPYLHYACGGALASAGRYSDALEQQKKETAVSPASALPWIQIAALQFRAGLYDDALHATQQAVTLEPNSSAAHHVKAQVLGATTGNAAQANEELRVAKSLAPEKPRPNDSIAKLYSRSSQERPATTADNAGSTSFEELVRQAAAAQAAGDVAGALQHYQQALQKKPDWDEGYWNVAMLCFSSGRYPQAVSALKEFVARKPNNGTAWAVMGLSEFETGDYDNALIHLQRGRELGFGGSAESVQLANYRLGLLLLRSGQFEQAGEVLSSNAASGPMAAQVEFARGLALLRMPTWPDQVEPAERPLVRESGEISALLAQSKYDNAFAKFQELLKDYPRTPFLHYTYGTALIAFSRYDEAAEEMRKEEAISPSSPLPYLRLASIALRQHQPAGAIEPAQRALRLAPDSAEAHYLLGRANFESGHVEVAVSELEKASALQPQSPEVHFQLAKAYAKAGLSEKAQVERATFTRLNAMAEQQRSRAGSQSYNGPHSSSDFASTPVVQQSTGLPEPH